MKLGEEIQYLPDNKYLKRNANLRFVLFKTQPKVDLDIKIYVGKLTWESVERHLRTIKPNIYKSSI